MVNDMQMLQNMNTNQLERPFPHTGLQEANVPLEKYQIMNSVLISRHKNQRGHKKIYYITTSCADSTSTAISYNMVIL